MQIKFKKIEFLESNKKEISDYLREHLLYPTMNHWNQVYGLAANVKLHRLGLTNEQFDKAIECIDGSVQSDWWETLRDYISDWEKECEGYSIITNGRSGGYFVVIAKDGDKYYPGRNNLPDRESYSNPDTIDLDEIKDFFDLAQSFDRWVYMTISDFKEYLDNHKLVEEEVITTTKIKVFQEI